MAPVKTKTEDDAPKDETARPAPLPDAPGDTPITNADEPLQRDAISHNLLGTAQRPIDPISHNPLGPVDEYDGDKHLDIGNIGDDEADLKAQLRALPTEQLLILSHAVRGEQASR